MFLFQSHQVDLLKVIGYSRAEVELVIGSPTRIKYYLPNGSNCQCERFVYLNGDFSIVYIEGRADWITAVLPAVDLLHVYAANIRFFTKSKTSARIKAFTMDEKACCPIIG